MNGYMVLASDSRGRVWVCTYMVGYVTVITVDRSDFRLW